MNIKRAFLAASAAVMLPGLAMAQLAPVTFPTTVDFSNNADAIVTVTLTCNTGTPLVQSFDISEGSGVDFVIQELDIAAATTACDVTMDGLASGYTSATVCSFGSVAPAVPLAETNPCNFTAQPVASLFEVYKVWENTDPDISLAYEFDVQCTNASLTTDGSSTTITGTFAGVGDGYGSGAFYPAPGQTSVCTATENMASLDSSVESDNGCAAGISFVIGTLEGSCTITNTIFFEGIPTLSQYGMAIMILLMLGVGFVGFRRFA